jgi:xanthine dehydrogenase accessory factor
MKKFSFILIRGAGDLASGTALRLARCGFAVVMTETSAPSSVRRTVCFSEAVYRGETHVEEVTSRLVHDTGERDAALARGEIPVFVDPDGSAARELCPAALIDAIMAKRNLGTSISDAPLVIALGPGFTAGKDCHAVIETKRGHTLGRVIWQGQALPDTGIPGNIAGYTEERLLRAPADGVFSGLLAIGDTVAEGEAVAVVRGRGDDGADAVYELRARVSGVLRGILPDGFNARKGMKAGDVDPRAERDNCFTVSDKSFSVAGGVLEALLEAGIVPPERPRDIVTKGE